jgi:hypothetical protein
MIVQKWMVGLETSLRIIRQELRRFLPPQTADGVERDRRFLRDLRTEKKHDAPARRATKEIVTLRRQRNEPS